MIVESAPSSSSRAEPSKSAGTDRRPARSFDDPFARTLTDMLSADRTDRPKPTERSRSGPAENVDRPPIERRQEPARSRSRDDREPRSRDDDQTPPVEVDVARTAGRDERSAVDDGAGTDGESKPNETGVEHAAARISELLGDDGAGNSAGLTVALAQLTDGTGAETEPVAPVEIAPDPASVEANAVEMDVVEGDPTLTVESAVDHEPVATADTDSADTDTLEVAPAAPGVDGNTVEAGPLGRTDQPLPGGRTVAELARDHRGVGLPEIVADMIEATDDPLQTASGAPGNASPVAPVARGDVSFAAVANETDTALPGALETDTEANDGETQVSTEEAPSITTEEPAAVEVTETAETADGAETPKLPVTDRPATVAPLGPDRVATAAPNRPAPVENAQPTPELVELRNGAVAEQLRPAFAALRRGLNGLDELRLRILDDNAGPIKVDIATVDNRIRVLLSTGNEELLRQLGQERDRLADELRRAGFDQASIDVASERGSEQRSRFEKDAPAPGLGLTDGSQTTDAVEHGLSEAISSRSGRRTSGLDLDL